MTIYLDSSVLLRYLLRGDPLLEEANAADVFGSSEILTIECQRVLQRERMTGHLDDWQYSEAIDSLENGLAQIHLIELGPAVKRRAAGPFPTVIGTLDAIHLASALLWAEVQPGSEISILTHDRQLELCARSLGLRVA